MGFLTQFFVQPWMLLGGLLVGVPIVIYLLQRHRYNRRPWAAMEFLLRAVKRHQRRIQLQNLLLLLIRCMILLCLALAMARPVLRNSPLPIAGSTSQQNWILALDTSYSMSYRDDTQRLFDTAREEIVKLAETMIQPGDTVALVTLQRAPRVVLSPTLVSEGFGSQLRRELEDLSLAAESVDLASSFALLDQVGGEFAGSSGVSSPKHIVMFTDLQRKDWMSGDEPRFPSLTQFIEKIQSEGGDFSLAFLHGNSQRPNLALTSLTISPPLIAKDVWGKITATVTNFGEQDADNVDLTIQIAADPGAPDSEPQLGGVVRVPAGNSVTRSLRFKFDEPGDHTVIAEVRSDGLQVDNLRYLVPHVEESVGVLLVDGEPTVNPLERETFFLDAALKPDKDDSFEPIRGRFTPFEPDTVIPAQLSEIEWGQYALVILANVGSFSSEDVTAIKSYVRGGGSLVVFMGDNVTSDLYHEVFHEEEGESLLPVRLGEVRGSAQYPVHLVVGDASHPVTRFFAEHEQSTRLHRPLISFSKYFGLTPLVEESPAFRVMFRFNDVGKTPAMFDNSYGAGRVLWCNSTADKRWADFPGAPDFVVFLYESISYLMRFGAEPRDLQVNQPFVRSYQSDEYASEVVLVVPEDEGELGGLSRVRTVHKAMRRTEGGSAFELFHEVTDVPGIYRLDLRRPHSLAEDGVEYFCVNVDTAESDLTPLSEDDLSRAFTSFKYRVLDLSEKERQVAREESVLRGRELWKGILVAVLALLVAETLLAWLFGRRAA